MTSDQPGEPAPPDRHDAVVRLDTEDVAELARRFTNASDGPPTW